MDDGKWIKYVFLGWVFRKVSNVTFELNRKLYRAGSWAAKGERSKCICCPYKAEAEECGRED